MEVVHKTVKQVFGERKSIFDQVLDQTLAMIDDGLRQRRNVQRHQSDDNLLFSPVSIAMFEAQDAGDTLLAIQLAEGALVRASNYERASGCEIHKGAIAFDLALMYLQLDNFSAAMRYFEIAEAETRATEMVADPTKAPSTFAIFRSDLFENNFWDRINSETAVFPVEAYKEVWNVTFSKSAAKDDWDKLSSSTKLHYVINLAQRMWYQQLAKTAGWDLGSSLYLAHWNLAADLARTIETELKRHKRCPPGSTANTLGALLEQCFRHTASPVNLSQLQINLHQHYRVTDAASFDAAFPDIRKMIEGATQWEDRIANAVYLLRAVRNQVAHSIDDSMVLFKDPKAATFTVDVLLALCRVNAWTT